MDVQVAKLVPVFALIALALAGCSEAPGEPTGDDFFKGNDTPTVEATATTGGIRGVVVDDTIKPIGGATIEVVGANKTFTTEDDGLFAVSGLEPGSYLVKASHPLFASAQQNAQVVAGEENPSAVKIQLIRTVFATPYMTVEAFDGYIVCSAGHPAVGYSEECGEGVGVPGLGRVGGQDNNKVQYDFYIDSLDVRTVQVEMYWEPTAQTFASGQLLTYVSTEWVCDPFCAGNTFVRGGSASPMLLRADVVNGTASNTTACSCETAKLATDAPISAFTWANPDTYDPVTGTVPSASVILNQPYKLVVVKSYVLPLPADYSFIAGSPDPFS